MGTVIVETRPIFSEGGEVIGFVKNEVKNFSLFLQWCREKGIFVPEIPENRRIHAVRDWLFPAFFRADSLEKICEVAVMAKVLGCDLEGDIDVMVFKIRKLLPQIIEDDHRKFLQAWAKNFLFRANVGEAEIIMGFVEGELNIPIDISKVCSMSIREWSVM
jgi:hypothetical protein